VRDAGTLERIAQLAIPPAWSDVWICPWSNGHLQAVGTDAAGRRQYRYHEEWRRRRDAEKFDRMLEFARALPALRSTVSAHLATGGPGRERVLAGAVRLIDVGLFRVGGEEYAEEHETYGVATLLREHVRIARDGSICFDYAAKGGKERRLALRDAELEPLLRCLKRRRGGGDELLAWREGPSWHDVRSGDVNDYLKEHAGGEFSAKDFRTWSATVLAAAELAATAAAAAASPRGRRARQVSGAAGPSPSAQRRAVLAAMRAVAEQLGNTPAVCRSSYVDPRIVEHYRRGETLRLDDCHATPAGVTAALAEGQATDPWEARRRLEQLTLDLLGDAAAEALAEHGRPAA
jgi:DNA topoisomerase IB